MKLLFLAPEPFFQERGTPIAIKLALEVLGARSNPPVSIDLLTYGEGEDVSLPSVKNLRIWQPSLLRGLGPGISFKKLVCDIFFFVHVLALIWKNRREQYSLIHAVEESVFCAWLVRLLFGIPYVYDMDSSLAQQVVEKWQLLKPCYPCLAWLEKIAIRDAIAVVPVCETLAKIATECGALSVTVLSDVSLLKCSTSDVSVSLRSETCSGPDSVLITYIGNLEPYQGIDLLLESYAISCRKEQLSRLIIIGGREEHIRQYREKADRLGIGNRLVLTGQRPVARIDQYTRQSDVLVSPRSTGNNTPMKIYSYLHSGRAVVATRLPTHTQVLTDEVSLLSEATPEAYAEALLKIVTNAEMRQRLGQAAYELAVRRYTPEVFAGRLNSLYDDLCKRLTV